MPTGASVAGENRELGTEKPMSPFLFKATYVNKGVETAR